MLQLKIRKQKPPLPVMMCFPTLLMMNSFPMIENKQKKQKDED